MTASFPTPGPVGLELLRRAVAGGELVCHSANDQKAAVRLNGNGYLSRNPARRTPEEGALWHPTERGQALLAHLAAQAAEPAPAETADVSHAAVLPSWPERIPHHPLADLFPMLPDSEIAELAEDIRQRGQEQPVWILDGRILDGRNRAEACHRLEIDPWTDEYKGNDPLGFVLSLNLRRRHLTESQRAMVAAKIIDWDNGINQTTSGSANLQTRQAAQRLSISERAAAAAKRVRDHGAPALVKAIESGRVSVHSGEAISRLERAAQEEVLQREEREIVARAKEIRQRRQVERHAERLAHMGRVAEAGAQTAGMVLGKFPVIYADPPWRFGVHSEVTGREKSAENHYPTMTTEDICNLFAEIGAPATADAVLFLWATNPMLIDAFRVMQAWGFAYVHHWIWDKEVAGTGYWGRDRHELLLIGRRGSPATPLPGTQPETVHRERKTAHSAKPAFYAETIERLYPDIPKLEMFCRSPRPGWTAWGFEAQAGEAAE